MLNHKKQLAFFLAAVCLTAAALPAGAVKPIPTQPPKTAGAQQRSDAAAGEADDRSGLFTPSQFVQVLNFWHQFTFQAVTEAVTEGEEDEEFKKLYWQVYELKHTDTVDGAVYYDSYDGEIELAFSFKTNPADIDQPSDGFDLSIPEDTNEAVRFMMTTAYGFAIATVGAEIPGDELASWLQEATKDEVRTFPLFEDYGLSTLFMMDDRYHYAVTHVTGL